MKNHLLQSAINPIIGSFQAQMAALSASAPVTPNRVTPNEIPVAEEIVLAELTKDRLLQIATDAGIKVAKSWTKAKLIAAIEGATAAA